jgi:hypothetical protein
MPRRDNRDREMERARDSEIAYRTFNWDDESLGHGYGDMDDQEQRVLGGQGEIDAGPRGSLGSVFDGGPGDPAAYDRSLAVPSAMRRGEPRDGSGLREQSQYGGQGLTGRVQWGGGPERTQTDVGGFAGRGPAGYTRSDERILDEVCQRLTDDDHVDASEIEVEVTRGDVTLTGVVPDRQTRRRAEACVESIRGVTDIFNMLKVRR